MANYSELLNDINAAIYENNDQEIDALEVRAILREMVTSLGSGFLFKGIATPSSPSGTGTYEPDQNVFYLATTAGTYTYLGGLVVAAGEVAFLCFDGTWTKKSSALLSTGSIVDNTTTEDATKPLSAKQGKVLADAGAATAAEVTALGQEVGDVDTTLKQVDAGITNWVSGTFAQGGIYATDLRRVIGTINFSVITAQTLIVVVPTGYQASIRTLNVDYIPDPTTISGITADKIIYESGWVGSGQYVITGNPKSGIIVLREANNANIAPAVADNYTFTIEGVINLSNLVSKNKYDISTLNGGVERLNTALFRGVSIIDFSQYTHRLGNINVATTAGWENRSQTNHYLIPIAPGVAIKMIAPASGYQFSFLKESPYYDNLTQRPYTFPEFADGYDNVVGLAADVPFVAAAPDNALYLYLTVLSSATPPVVTIIGGINDRLISIENKVAPSGNTSYIGEKIKLSNNYANINQWGITQFSHQGGAIYQDKFFFCYSDGKVTVLSMTEKRVLTSFYLVSPSGALMPHCNSVFFGAKYAEGDPYPVLYVNAYNTIGLPKGTLYGYRIVDNGGVLSCTLVQTITIGFTTSSIWTDGEGDTRPYGNFVLDFDNNILYAYTLLDTTKVTRFFAFDMPAPIDGDVSFAESDMLRTFDAKYINIIQDNFYKDGKIYICSGYGTSTSHGLLNVVDLLSGEIVSLLDLYNAGFAFEPEYIDIYAGAVYCGDDYIYQLNF